MVDLVEVLDDTFLDISAALAEATRDVVHDLLSHGVVIDLAEEGTGLLVVGVRVRELVATGLANHGLLLLCVLGSLDGSAVDRVGLVIRLRSVTSVDGHEAITDVVVLHGCAVWAVDGDLIVVGSESVSMGIGVVDEATLEHLAVGRLNTWDHMGGSESGLLGLGVEVLRVLVKDKSADLLERVVAMGPDLGQIVDVESIVIGISDGHDLSVPSPGGEVALLDIVEKVHGGVILGLHAHLAGGLVGEVLDALVSLVVILDEEFLTGLVDPLESVGAISVHVSETIRGAAVGHQDGHLVESLRGVAPEVPGHVGVLDAGLRVSLLGVDEVRELHGVLDEEHGRVVADHVVVTLLGVVLEGEATGVTIAVVGAALTGDGGEAEEDRRALADLVHEGSLAEPKKVKDTNRYVIN